ncbi:MAG TPA: D-2-hydroxyacid dehydrogenase [Candidatus Eisenbacteria bacterium]|nr:D-2-hydroxyacid dehydrogenase [Candidatus Eisenbacteria bacterium]
MNKDTILLLGKERELPLALLDAIRPQAEIIVGDSLEGFANRTQDARVILNWSGSLELFRGVFLRCPNLRWVHSRSAGLERSLFPELVASEVPLTNGTGVFSDSLGEFVLGAMLYFAKDFRRMIRSQARGAWDPFTVHCIAGKVVGIVGYGDIGRSVAERARAMGMTVLALRRNVSRARDRDALVAKVYSSENRKELLAQSDYVVVAAPLTEETRGMIGEAELAVMKPTAVLINVGRGPIIEEKALIRALSENRIKGAALDVFEQEPLPPGHPFYRMENVLLSPHCADNTPEWLADAMKFFVAQYGRFRAGEPLQNIVDKQRGY